MSGPPLEVSLTDVAIGSAVRGRRTYRRLGLGSLGIGFASALAGAVWSSSITALIGPAMLLGGLFFLLRLGVNTTRAPQGLGHATVEADDSVVVSFGDRERRARREDVLQGYLLEPQTVVLELRGGEELACTCDDPAAAQALVERLGLSAQSSVLRVPLISVADRGSSIGRIVGLLMFLLDIPIAAASSLAWMSAVGGLFGSFDARHLGVLGILTVVTGVSWLVGFLLLRYMSKQSIRVGADGVEIERFGPSRFIPYSRMKRVEKTLDGLRLVLDRGSVPLRLSFSPIEPASAEREGREVLLGRIEDARRAAGNSGVAAAKLASLDRRNRSMGEWKSAMRALPGRESDYRHASFETDELLRVALDTALVPERRIGAVLALGEADPAIKKRVRVAIDACADAEMKRALEEAAEGEIEEASLERATRRQT